MEERHLRGRLALIGLDGVSFGLLDTVTRAGAMPAMARLRGRSAQAVLHSTIPTYTPPAWVSISTGVNPGRHGIFGFLANTPQEPPRVAHSGLIRATPMWRFLNEMGVRTGIFNVPMSYPPSAVDGFMIAGGLAAGWTDPELPNFGSDQEAMRLVLEIAEGTYPLDTVVSYENDWRSSAVIPKIESVQRLRRKALGALLERFEPDMIYAVFEGPDRMMHVHYQYVVESSDWYGRPEASQVRELAMRYFEELDRAIEELVAWVGPDGHVMVVSDHGCGPWEKTVNVNILLERWGYLELPSIGRLTSRGPIAGAGQRLARRIVPRRLLHVAKARVTRGIKWGGSRAFASHVAEQGIHVNERGVLPQGFVDPGAVPAIVQELSDRLTDLTDPVDGLPVTDRVYRREEVIEGPFASRAPHLFPICRDQRYELSDTVAAASPITDHRDRPWGYHHRDGIFIAAGPSVAQGFFEEPLHVVDVLPTMLHMVGLPVPSGLDGSVARSILEEAMAREPVMLSDAPANPETSEENPYTPEEEALIEESLRGLGYID